MKIKPGKDRDIRAWPFPIQLSPFQIRGHWRTTTMVSGQCTCQEAIQYNVMVRDSCPKPERLKSPRESNGLGGISFRYCVGPNVRLNSRNKPQATHLTFTIQRRYSFHVCDTASSKRHLDPAFSRHFPDHLQGRSSATVRIRLCFGGDLSSLSAGE